MGLVSDQLMIECPFYHQSFQTPEQPTLFSVRHVLPFQTDYSPASGCP
jgi:hypothetical protein